MRFNRVGDRHEENELRAMADLVRDADQDPGLIESSALELIRRPGKGDTQYRATSGSPRKSASTEYIKGCIRRTRLNSLLWYLTGKPARSAHCL